MSRITKVNRFKKNYNRIFIAGIGTMFLVFVPFFYTAAADNQPKAAENKFESKILRPVVRIFDSKSFELEKEFYPFLINAEPISASIAVLDLDSDGINEIVVGAGKGDYPQVRIFHSDGSLVNYFLAYAETYRDGIVVSGGDLDNDGKDEIVTGTLDGGGPHLRIFDGLGNLKFNKGFFPFDKSLRNGLNVAVGDVNNDRRKEIVVAQGFGGDPRVLVLTKEGYEISSFNAFSPDFFGGVNLAVKDIDNDNFREIIAGAGVGGGPQVRIFNFLGELEAQFFTDDAKLKSGVNITAADLDNDQKSELITGSGFGVKPYVKFFDKLGASKINPGFLAFEESFKGGVKLDAGDVDGDKQQEILVITSSVPKLDVDYFKYVEINLSEQKLYAFERGALLKTLLVSSGTWRHPTPTGKYKIYTKIKSGRMDWFYGPDNPDNYDLKNVPNILPFYGSYTIHGAYWHHNFGHRMSHGCINLSIPDSKWMYDWADVGTTVIIHN